MKKVLALMMALVLVLSLVACGGSSDTGEKKEETPAADAATEVATETPTEAPTEPAKTAIDLKVGDTTETDLFKMTIDSIEIKDEYSYRTSDISTSTLYVEDGYKLLIMFGHFENKGTNTISDSAFQRKVTVNDTFVKDDYDVRMSFMRNKSFEVDAYTDIDYCIYVNIPENLANQYEKSVFSISFKNDLSLITKTYNSDGSITSDVDVTYDIYS